MLVVGFRERCGGEGKGLSEGFEGDEGWARGERAGVGSLDKHR